MSVCIERDPDPTGSASFDGACYGWRIGPYRVMVAEGLDRNVHADCDVKLYGDSIETSGLPAADHPTDLDIEFSAVPVRATIEDVEKWACGYQGFSDRVRLTLDPANEWGIIEVDRALWGSKSIEMDVRASAVAACTVRGLPAVCVDRPDDMLGQNPYAMIVVIEDGTLDPNAVVVRVWSEDLPLDELMRVAESVVRA